MLPSVSVMRNGLIPTPVMSFPFPLRSAGETCQIHPAFLPLPFSMRTPTGLVTLSPQGMYQACKGQSFTIDAILGCRSNRRMAEVDNARVDATHKILRKVKPGPMLGALDGIQRDESALTCTEALQCQHTSLAPGNTGE